MASHYLLLFFLPPALLLLLSICYLFSTRLLNFQKKRIITGLLPPGPAPIPVLGNLHLLIGSLPHRSFLNLSNKYGPIMHIRLGSVRTVVVSSANIAMEILKTQDQIFASRPSAAVVKCITYSYSDVASSPYNSHWRYMRKMLTSELLTSTRMQQCKNLRMQEVCVMLQSIQNEISNAAAMEGGSSCTDHEVNLLNKLTRMGFDLISRMLLKERFTGSTRKDVLELETLLGRIIVLFRAFVPSDFVPSLAWFDPFGYKRQAKIIHKRVDRVLDQILREHEEDNSVEQRTDHDQDFLDTLLFIQKAGKEESKFLSRNAIKATVLNLFLAGADTSSHTIIWAVSELLLNPELFEQAQTEVDSLVGHNRMVDESDIPQLTFLQAIVKETFRLHPVAPLLIPRQSLEDCKVAGYDIPRATLVFVNAWAIGRDPSVWERPLAFYPERFLEESSHIEANGQNFNLLPFGSGRRGCPGMALGSTMVHLTLASLLHCFDWSLPEGQSPKELDMQEAFGAIAGRKKPLMAILKPRASAKFYMDHISSSEVSQCESHPHMKTPK